MEVENSYFESAATIMPNLETENGITIVPGGDDDPGAPTIPNLEIQHQEKPAERRASTSTNKRKLPLLVNPLLDDDLEDDELQFKGYCYTMTGSDGTKRVDDTHACDYCPAIFDSRVGLTNHAKLHGAEKKMKCEICDFSCTNKKTMRFHRRIHGIIPQRGRRAGTGKRQLEAKAIKLEIMMAADEPKSIVKMEPQEMVQQQIGVAVDGEGQPTKMEAATGRRRSTRRRTIRSGEKLCPNAGAVEGEEGGRRHEEDGEGEEEERIVIIPLSTNQPQKNASRGFEEEECADRDATQQQRGKKTAKRGRRKQEHAAQVATEATATAHARPDFGCAVCPYRTPQLTLLDQHMLGHSRTSGYVCSICNFKHEHKRWLHHHCMLHQQQGGQCQWPPVYVYGEERGLCSGGGGADKDHQFGAGSSSALH